MDESGTMLGIPVLRLSNGTWWTLQTVTGDQVLAGTAKYLVPKEDGTFIGLAEGDMPQELTDILALLEISFEEEGTRIENDKVYLVVGPDVFNNPLGLDYYDLAEPVMKFQG